MILALAAGCGGNATSGSPDRTGAARPATSATNAAALVSAASGATLGKQSSRVASTVVSSSGLRLQSTGAYDYRRGNAVFDLTTTTGGRTTKQRILLVAGTAYLTVPGLSAGGKYVKLNLSDLTGRSGGTSFDSTTQLSLLRGTTDSLLTVGTETVRGVPTTRIAGTLDQRKALAAVPGAQQRAALRKLNSLVATPSRVPVELWIDAAGVLRRLKQQVALSAQKVGSVSVPASTVTTTTEFYDFGVPVKAVAPPASAVLG